MSVEGVKRTIINTCAFEAVDAIIADLRGRSGLDGMWDGIDDDIQEEIRLAWARIVAASIAKAAGEERLEQDYRNLLGTEKP